MKTLLKFLDRNKLQRALLITRDTETKFQKERLFVDAVPYWKYWSIKQKTG